MKAISRFLFVLLLANARLLSDPRQEFETGKIFFETKQYDKAQKQFQKAIEEAQAPWELAVLHYNLGTVQLKRQDWDEALIQFRLANSIKNKPPYLLTPLAVNFAIAIIQREDAMLKKDEKSPFLSASRLTNPITLLDIAYQTLTLAEEGSCQLTKIRGTPDCELDPKIESLRQILNRQKSKVLEREKMFKLKSIPFRNGVEILRTELKQWIHQLTLLQKDSAFYTTLPPEDYYRQMYPLIKALNQRTAELSKEDGQLFLDARNHIRTAINNIVYASARDALFQLQTAEKKLEQLLENLPKDPPVVEKIRSLTEQLSNLLIYQKIELTDLKEFLIQSRELAELAKKSSFSYESVKNAAETLETADKELQLQHYFDGHVYLLRTVQILQRILISYRLQNAEPSDYLLYAIEVQQDALDLAYEVNDTANYPEEFNSMLLDAQNTGLEAGALFPGAVRNRQEKQYSQSGNKCCAKKPWTATMPLFYKGYQKAYEASRLLATARPSLTRAIDLQRKTLSFWRQALISLQEEEAPKEQINSEEDLEALPANYEQLIQTIIELEQMDRQETRKPAPKKNHIEKPW